MGAISCRTIRIGHAADPETACRAYALVTGQVDLEGIRFEHLFEDPESLNAMMLDDKLDVADASVHALGCLVDRCSIIPETIRMFDGGPFLFAREPVVRDYLKRKSLAVPGEFSLSALLVPLLMNHYEFEVIHMPGDEIPGAIRDGGVDAGLLESGPADKPSIEMPHRILDLSELWWERSGFPHLPRSVTLLRHHLPLDTRLSLGRIIRRALGYMREHWRETLVYASSRFSSARLPSQPATPALTPVAADADSCREQVEQVQALLSMAAAEQIIPSGSEMDCI
jgi:predicted solute-binding protein